MSVVSERDDMPDSRCEVSIRAVVPTVIESKCEVWEGLDLKVVFICTCECQEATEAVPLLTLGCQTPLINALNK